MSAIRLARGFTKKNKIIKFSGCYHGHSDSLLIKAGSGALTFGVPSSPGVPDVLAQHTVTLPFNDLDALREAFDQLGNDTACVITEPVTGNMNCILPEPGYLEGMRELCTEHGAILIFDEVMTSRLGPGGYQGVSGVTPDMMTMGKYLGGGLTFGAFGGKQEIMARFDPAAPDHLSHAGTLDRHGVKGQVTGYGSMMMMHLTDQALTSPADSAVVNATARGLFHLGMIERGYYVARRNMMVLSLPMGTAELDGLVDAVDDWCGQYGSLFA